MSRKAELRASSGEPREIHVRPIPVAGGVIVAYLSARALALALGATPLASIGDQVFLAPLIQFVGLLAGGYVAGRWAGRSGFMNGVAVAVVFIVVWAGLTGFFEARLVQDAGPAALPKMNMGGIVLGDLLNLSAAAFGGWLSERKEA